MALPKRNEADRATAAPFLDGSGDARPTAISEPFGYRFDLGGPVGEMHADIARRIAEKVREETIEQQPVEQVVRSLSKAGGYVALIAGYVLVALLFVR